MCNYFDNNVPTENLEKEFRKVFAVEEETVRADMINGFAHQQVPVIQNEVHDEFVAASWGISAPWIQRGQKKILLPLNARLETVHSKHTFKNNAANRCCIPVNAFYEWRWLDAKGRQKEKNRIAAAASSIFTLAGIYYIDERGEVSFAVCTTEANELMSYIHNIKKRMPVILPLGMENSWLNIQNDILDFSYPNYDPALITTVV